MSTTKKASFLTTLDFKCRLWSLQMLPILQTRQSLRQPHFSVVVFVWQMPAQAMWMVTQHCSWCYVIAHAVKAWLWQLPGIMVHATCVTSSALACSSDQRTGDCPSCRHDEICIFCNQRGCCQPHAIRIPLLAVFVQQHWQDNLLISKTVPTSCSDKA